MVSVVRYCEAGYHPTCYPIETEISFQTEEMVVRPRPFGRLVDPYWNLNFVN